MAHSEPLVITQQEDGGANVTVRKSASHQRTPLLESTFNKEANRKMSILSRLKDRVILKSKAANLILVWNLLVSLLYGIMLNPGISILGVNDDSKSSPYYYDNTPSLTVGPAVYGFVAITLLFYPLAGYLGDVRFGRYKTVRCSSCTVWLALLSGVLIVGIVGVFLTVFLTVDIYSWIVIWMIIISFMGLVGGIALIAIIVGIAGFRANVIQFGMDQLQDSPAKDSSLFIFWFLGTMYTGIGLGKIAWSVLFSCFPLWIAIITTTVLVFLIAMPIALCVGHYKRRWFVQNPGMGNPYKHVKAVVSFARRHKIPVQRSAFTYWEEDIPSGLDLGKEKYGGPFTTEQVENVNAFFGILKVLLSLGPFFIVDFAASESLLMLSHHMYTSTYSYVYPWQLYPYQSEITFANWVIMTNGVTLYPWLVVLMIAFYITVHIIPPQHLIYRIQKYFPGMLKRVGIGLCLITVSLICSLAMDTTGHIMHPDVPCLFQPIQYNYIDSNGSYYLVAKTLKISPYILIIQNLLVAAAYILIYSGIFEFICAQSPHSMKGFLIGLLFAIKGLFQLLGVTVLYIPFNSWYINTENLPISCGFIYYLVNIIISIIGVLVFTYAAKKYKYRQRDELCDNRRYIEEYYENVVNHNPPDPEDDLL